MELSFQDPSPQSFAEIKDHRRWEKDKNFSWSRKLTGLPPALRAAARLDRFLPVTLVGHVLAAIVPFLLFISIPAQ